MSAEGAATQEAMGALNLLQIFSTRCKTGRRSQKEIKTPHKTQKKEP